MRIATESLNYIGIVENFPNPAKIGDVCIKDGTIYVYRNPTWVPIYTMSPFYTWEKPEEKYFSAEEFII